VDPQAKPEDAHRAEATASRDGARMTVGDVSPAGPDEVEPAPTDEPPASLSADRATTADRPIEGDRITAAGELILASGRSAAGLPVLPQTARLKVPIEDALRYYWDRPEDAAQRTHWGMMHSIMVFDRDTPITN